MPFRASCIANLAVALIATLIFADDAVHAAANAAANPFQKPAMNPSQGTLLAGSFGNSPPQSSIAYSLSLAHCSLPSGTVQDTCCQFETAQQVNNKLLPALTELVKTTVFRYFKVNLQKQCPFWNENMFCMNEHCSVAEVHESEIPLQWRTDTLSSINWGKSKAKGYKMVKKCEFNDKDFCQLEDEFTEGGSYVDLVRNPERFTGYSGESAERIWSAIYRENCFHGSTLHGQGSLANPFETSSDDMCTEKRVFYKMISGLHSSISMHICDQWLNQATGEWIQNLDCFADRLARYPDRLENLYFLWAIVVRSASKLAPYLSNYPFCEGTQDERLVKMHVDQVTKIVSSCPSTFDEKIMFSQAPYLALKDEFKQRFHNISRIMDCVGCEKCRLWGKIQITGLGTALKVLFSYGDDASEYRLSRSELVAFMNVFHRLSESLVAVDRFQARLLRRLAVKPLHSDSGAGKADRMAGVDLGSTVNQAVTVDTKESSTVLLETTLDAVIGATDTPTSPVPIMTAEYLLLHTDLFQPEHALLYIVGFVVAILGLARLLQKAYDKNVRADIQAAKDRLNKKDK
ncbi:hypothetical protein BASA61_006325 [Batrachochytrium salamandrivorans]|nr:hypothetical protein BASA62_002103 [Batrachochytrium salamandrivorans]KAH6587377.1 hypothetical protein BASA61_006325 [Batrachochytrium salamandrivorans]KAH9272901.1 hypothetical protein BASA83_004790 [Batrachochytrium salamandrivorans]